MTNFEFQRTITIGQYLPTGSVIHQLDARTRLLGAIVLIGVVTGAQQVGGLALALGAALLLLRVARVPLCYALRGVIAPLPFIVFLAVLQILFGTPESVTALWSWGIVRVSLVSLLAALIIVVRFVTLVLVISLFSFCVATPELVRGLESLLKPLARFGFPAQDVVLLVQVALRFLPLLAQEAERIAKAQAARGAEWGTGRGGVLRRARQAMPLLLPLFLTTLRRANDLALAMEARGYRGTGRTSMVALRFGVMDGVAGVLLVMLVVGIVLL